ncbi:PAS domain S-box protein [Leptospira sp. 96542]|nr:PAS domain S-box protein [Leptospira sp. 96542]
MIAFPEKSILLVEDEALLAMMEKSQLEREGYSVRHVMDGESALELILKNEMNFDLILMDIDLGDGLDGTETATEILKHRQIPVVFLSSHTEREVVQKTETITSYGYVVKNSGITVLDASIKMAFKLFRANELTKHQKEHLETVLHSIGDAVIATDIQGNILHMNPIAEHLTGWNFDLAKGKPLSEIFKIINSKTREPVENPVDLVLKTDQIVGLANHTVLVSKDGEEFQIADSGSPIKDLKGNTSGVVLVFRDVTEEYKIQTEIAKQANMLNNVSDSIIVTDPNLKITYWNSAAQRIYGWKSDEVYGKFVNDVLETEFVGISREEVFQSIFANGNYIGEVIQKNKAGNTVDIEVNTIILNNKNSQHIGYIAVGRDISERIANVRSIKKSEARLTQILESAMDAIISVDANKKIILFNAAAESMFGYESTEMIGEPLTQLIPMDFRSQHDKHIDNFGKTGVSKRGMGSLGQIKGLRKNGEEFPIEASISQIDLDGEKLFTVILRDETNRSLADLKIKTLLSEKEHILKEIHHRVKNNMSAVFTLLSLQANAQTSIENKTILLEAAGRVKSMIVLYDRLYHSKTDNSVPVKEYFPSLIEEILSIFPHTVSVKVEILDDEFELGAKLLSHLGIIINELITNSMKHAFKENSNGEIKFQLSKNDKHVFLSYADNGPGIPNDVTFSNTPGFGLQLVDTLVKQINGNVQIDRSQGAKYEINFVLN